MEGNSYYFITMFSADCSENGFINFNKSRCWGFYQSKETAIKAVKHNWTDMWETIYDYAVVEEFYEGISAIGEYRQFFKYNIETGRYDEIKTPECFEHYISFGIG